MNVYLEAAGLLLNDHRYRQLSTSYGHTPAVIHRPRRRNAKVFSRAVAPVKAWAECRRLARDLYARDDRLLADAGLTHEDIPAVLNGTYVRQPESALIEYPATRQVSAHAGAARAAANDDTRQIAA